MAAFTDQFSKQSPFDLPLRYEFYSWPTQIADESIALISCRDIAWLTAIARQLDHVIEKAAASSNPQPTGHMHVIANIVREEINMHRGVFRDLYGDLKLLMEGHDSHDWEAEAVQSSKVDRFVVFCLWKLVDVKFELHDRAKMGTDIDRRNATQRGGAYTIEAMRALQIAQSIRLQEQALSDRNRENGILANPNAEANRQRALQMAEEMPFRSMSKAADHIASNLVKGTTKAGKEVFYSTEWIKGWLREANWAPQHKRKEPQ